jgi:serine/threonine protein kinase
MGSVYLARLEGAAGFRKPVAVKVIHQHLIHNAEAIRSFIREAKVVVRLRHPNIVQVLDFGEHSGQYLTILEYVYGYDLSVFSEFLRRSGRALSVSHSGFVIYQVLKGLELAHNLRDNEDKPLGLVHCDISPQNVLVSSEGQVLLTDFGIARTRVEFTATSRENLQGKISYLAPEQVTGGVTDHRSDLFALGIVLFEVLSGQRLFASANEAQTVLKIANGVIPDIIGIRPDLPSSVGAILSRALAREPSERYQSAQELARDIREHLLDGSPDEVEESFRDVVRQTFRNSDFESFAGPLPNVEEELAKRPLSLPGLGISREYPAFRVEELSKEVPKAQGRASFKLLLSIAVGVAVLSSLVFGAVLYGRALMSERAAVGGEAARVVVETLRQPVTGALDAGAESASGRDSGASDAGGGKNIAADSALQPDVSAAGGSPANAVKSGGRSSEHRVSGKLTGARVTRELMKRQGSLVRCFKGSGGQDLSIKSVVIRLEISGEGSVRWAKVEPAGLNGTKLGKCLVNVAQNARFPRHDAPALIFRIPIAVTKN